MVAGVDDVDLADDVGYLVIDRFLPDVVTVRALLTAFERGWIDRLLVSPRSLEQLAESSQLPRDGAAVLVELLANAGVVARMVVRGDESSWGLSGEFRGALQYRDLLEVKLRACLLAAADCIELFPVLLEDRPEFLRESRIVRLFAYERALSTAPDDLQVTAEWMRMTTLLSRYESAAGLRRCGWERRRRLLDVGGNSGEFARLACASFPQLQATVFDLPAVCHVGDRYLQTFEPRPPVQFLAGSALTDRWPREHDVISFKSMLHDWPDALANDFLDRACEALPLDGEIVIFERGPVHSNLFQSALSQWPMLLFYRSFRGPDRYVDHLHRRGFETRVQTFVLDMPFFVLTAQRGSAA